MNATLERMWAARHLPASVASPLAVTAPLPMGDGLAPTFIACVVPRRGPAVQIWRGESLDEMRAHVGASAEAGEVHVYEYRGSVNAGHAPPPEETNDAPHLAPDA